MPANWFIALPVRDTGWLTGLLEGCPRGQRRFLASDLHITVAFLGACGEDGARRAWACSSSGGPFSVTLGGLRAMGDPRRYSALSLELDQGRAEVAEAIGRWRGPMFEAAGARPERRPPLPHCTVCRPSRRASERERAAGLGWARGVAALTVPLVLDRVALYTWAEDRKTGLFRVVEERGIGG